MTLSGVRTFPAPLFFFEGCTAIVERRRVVRNELPQHPTRLYLIRHGEVEERYHRIFGGCQIDMELSPLGHQHGQAVASWLGDRSFKAIYSSPMVRVQQTLAPLAARTGLTPVKHEGLREMDFGAWTGHRWDAISEQFGVSAFDWLEIIETGGIVGGETAADLADRVRPVLLKILHDHPHEDVALFCHGGIIRVILSLLLGQPLRHTSHYNIEYGSISIIEIQPDKRHGVEIELLNFCPPLAAV